MAVVTGANSGIGLETGAALAGLGAKTVLACRNESRALVARHEIVRRHPEADVELLQLDLGDLAQIAGAAAEATERFGRIDVCVNNAGAIMRQRSVTVDGFETTFGVNHLGHFLLTQLLLDQIRASAPSRIVVVSSDAHKQPRKGLDFDDLMSERSYSAFRVYGKTKLANIYFTRELARRLDGTETTANALHPGYVASRFGRDGDTGKLGEIAMMLGRPFAISAEKGARTSVYLASSPDVAGVSGAYFYKCREKEPSAAARDDEAARRLWAVSEELVSAS